MKSLWVRASQKSKENYLGLRRLYLIVGLLGGVEACYCATHFNGLIPSIFIGIIALSGFYGAYQFDKLAEKEED